MPIPFGVGVGDFIAVGKLIKQIVIELQEIGGAVPLYQDLLLELEALRRALAQLERLRPASNEFIQLNAIRATAITCKRPLEEFLSRISKFESRLGIFNTKNNRYKGFARRMQFSMIYKDDIEQLRSILGSHVAIINLLLMTRTVESITAAKNDRERIAYGLESKILVHRQLLEDMKCQGEISLEHQLETKLHLRHHSTVLEDLGRKADKTSEHLRDQGALLQDVQTAVTIAQVQTTTILTISTDILVLIGSGITDLQLLRRQLGRIFELFTRFTNDMQEAMYRHMLLFSGIYASLRRIEALLPMRINLPIVKFTDALGDTMALPYQLCQQWSTFRLMLGVIFSAKPGKSRVEMGQYLIMNARGGRLLREASWQHVVKQDDHLSMSMILDDLEVKDGFCPFPSCQASLAATEVKNGGRTCLECGRWAVLAPQERIPGINSSDRSWSAKLKAESEFLEESGWDVVLEGDFKEEDIEVYRQIHVRTSAGLSRNQTLSLKDLVEDEHDIPDSGIDLREFPPQDKASEPVFSTDEAIDRLMWPPINEEFETVDLHSSQRRRTRRPF